MKTVQIGGHAIPAWLLGTIMAAICAGSVVAYVALTVTIPLEVNEPLEVLSGPSQLTLYPGEDTAFNVTVRNNAEANYVVNLLFSMSNQTYMANYATFNSTKYLVIPGVQNLTTYIEISSSASLATDQLTVQLQRTNASIMITNARFCGTSGNAANYLNLTVRNISTKIVRIGQVKINNVAMSTLAGNWTLNPGVTGRIVGVSNVGWVIGNPYNINLFDSKGNLVGSYQAFSPS